MYVSVVISCVILLAFGGPKEIATKAASPTDNDEDAVRSVDWEIKPGKPKIVTNPGYRQPARGEGDIKYNFTVQNGFGILGSCDDDYRPSTNFERPCDVFTINFDDGDKKKRLCSHYWLTETYFLTNRSQLSFQMNYTEGGSSIVRCVFRSTEHLSKPSRTLKVPKDSAINSPKRKPFSEDYYLIEGEKDQRFNLACRFADTENSYCVLSRVVIKVEGKEEMFCMSTEYRRKNIKKAEIFVSSDGNGWPEIYCNMTVGSTSEADTKKMQPYGKRSRRDYIKRDEVYENLKLKAGQTKEFGTKDLGRDKRNVLKYDISVPAGNKIYVFCDVYKPEIDGTLPCDTFSIIMEEEGKAPEYWCSRRHLESLGHLTDGNNLKLTIENFSNKNNVTCAVRSTELPEPEQVISLTKDNKDQKILVSKKPEPYMVRRWTIKHSGNGQINISCTQNILRSVYQDSQGVGIIKRQYYCFQRRIQVNDQVKCEAEDIEKNYYFESHGKADLVIMTDKKGLTGHLCNIWGIF